MSGFFSSGIVNTTAIPDSATIQGSRFFDSFEDESADSGVPENFEAGSNGAPETTEVSTTRALDGGQSLLLVDSGDGGAEGVRPSGQPYSATTDSVEVFIYPTQTNSRGAILSLFESGSQIALVIVGTDGVKYFDGSYTFLDSTAVDEWVRIKIFNIDVNNNQYDINYEYQSSGNSGTSTVSMDNNASSGWTTSRLQVFAGDGGHFDPLLIGD